MDETLTQLLGAKATTALVIVYFINWLKHSKWFPFITRETTRLNHLLAVALTGAGAIGIHATFSHDTHTLVISGLSLASILPAAANWCQQYVMTKVGYNLLQSRLSESIPVPVAVEQLKQPTFAQGILAPLVPIVGAGSAEPGIK